MRGVYLKAQCAEKARVVASWLLVTSRSIATYGNNYYSEHRNSA